jgi:hypothetical protein
MKYLLLLALGACTSPLEPPTVYCKRYPIYSRVPPSNDLVIVGSYYIQTPYCAPPVKLP